MSCDKNRREAIKSKSQMEAVLEESRGQPHTTPFHNPVIIREKQLPNETKIEARKRWRRELEIELERSKDTRRVGNRIMPVLYD